MLKSMVIFIDGLPGTGKTSLSCWLDQRFVEAGVRSHLISEYDIPHPLHWFNYHDENDYIPPDFVSIPMSIHMGESIDKWMEFKKEILSNKGVNIVDGYPFINSLGVFIWGDADKEDIYSYTTQLLEMVVAINPVVIFLDSQDVASALDRKLEILRGERFLDQFLLNMNNLPFLLNRGISGSEGILQLWREINQLMQQFYLDAQFRCLVLDRDSNNEAVVRSEAEEYLNFSNRD